MFVEIFFVMTNPPPACPLVVTYTGQSPPGPPTDNIPRHGARLHQEEEKVSSVPHKYQVWVVPNFIWLRFSCVRVFYSFNKAAKYILNYVLYRHKNVSDLTVKLFTCSGWLQTNPASMDRTVQKVSSMRTRKIQTLTVKSSVVEVTENHWTAASASRAPAALLPGTLSRKSGDRKVAEIQASLKSISPPSAYTRTTSSPVSRRTPPRPAWSTRRCTGAAPRCVRREVWRPPDTSQPPGWSSQVRICLEWREQFLFPNVRSDVHFSHYLKFQIGVSKVPWLHLILKMLAVRLVIQIMRTQLRSMTKLPLMMTAIAGLIVSMSASNSRQMRVVRDRPSQVGDFYWTNYFLSPTISSVYISSRHQNKNNLSKNPSQKALWDWKEMKVVWARRPGQWAVSSGTWWRFSPGIPLRSTSVRV